jgi:hypothetical protein
MASRSHLHRTPVALFAGFVSVSAWLGALGMAGGLLPVGPTLAPRLPFHSPVFGGIALALVVAVPTTAGTVLAWRRNPRAGAAVTLSGLLLIAWIVVETVIVRQYSPLQLIFLVAGIGLAIVGDRATIRAVGAVLVATPLFLTAPIYRRWHLHWGATSGETRAPMPGDDVVPVAQFVATRAVTIDAAPEAVWPWLVQVGFGRAGFYSYDLLDNLARPSADTLRWRWQHPVIGDVAAPMTNPPTAATSFTVADIEAPTRLVWTKPDSTWAWILRRLPDGRTRLITRLKQRYRGRLGVVVTIVLAEFGDFAMMRRMLLGIKKRAEDSGLVQ